MNESNKRPRTTAPPAVNNINEMAATPHTNLSAAASKSIVHLSVTKAQPSHIEPWRKLSPISLVGCGILIDWDACSGDAAAAASSCMNNEGCLRILTTSSTVHHATFISASITASSSPISVSCRVEWMSLPMDLALLKIESNDPNWAAAAQDHCAIISDRLPVLGEQIAMAAASTNKILHDIGIVSNYFADEEDHFMLRMQVSTVSSASSSGGVVVDQNGHISGLSTAASSTIAIPGVVLHQFINLCRDSSTNAPLSDGHKSGTTSESDGAAAAAVSGETDESSHKCTSHKSHSDAAASQSERDCDAKSHCISSSSTKDHHHDRTDLPGIASLGVTGYQTLENKALRKSFGVDTEDVNGVRITGIHHTAHPTTNSSVDHDSTHCNRVDDHCHSSLLRVDDILLSINNEPIMFNGTVKLGPGRENERVNFQWLLSRCTPGTKIKLEVIRQKKRLDLTATLCEPRYLIPRLHEERNDELPSYVIVGGCVFVPLTHSWIKESQQNNPSIPVEGYHRYLQEQRRGDQQLVILSQVLADGVNLGYHGMTNLLLVSANGQRITNIQHLVDVLVKSGKDSLLEFRCSDIHAGRSKIG
jgi:hypothetical protein